MQNLRTVAGNFFFLLRDHSELFISVRIGFGAQIYIYENIYLRLIIISSILRNILHIVIYIRVITINSFHMDYSLCIIFTKNVHNNVFCEGIIIIKFIQKYNSPNNHFQRNDHNHIF